MIDCAGTVSGSHSFASSFISPRTRLDKSSSSSGSKTSSFVGEYNTFLESVRFAPEKKQPTRYKLCTYIELNHRHTDEAEEQQKQKRRSRALATCKTKQLMKTLTVLIFSSFLTSSELEPINAATSRGVVVIFISVFFSGTQKSVSPKAQRQRDKQANYCACIVGLSYGGVSEWESKRKKNATREQRGNKPSSIHG